MTIKRNKVIDNSIEMITSETLIRFGRSTWEERLQGAHGLKMFEVPNPRAELPYDYNALVIFSRANGFIKSIELIDERDQLAPKWSASKVKVTFTRNMNEAMQVESMPITLSGYSGMPSDIYSVYLRGTVSSSNCGEKFEAYPALEAIEALESQFEVAI
ncbi:MAG: hypothetical protein ACRCU2_00420 [Planktothrix sp.]